MLMDHACLRFRQVVVQQFGSNNVVWARYQGEQTYPWCSLQIVDGPTSRVQQRKWIRRRQVEWTIADAVADTTVAARIGGRILNFVHTGDAASTAVNIAALLPAHWTTIQVGPVLTITGPDIVAGVAYEGSTMTTAEIGDPFMTEVVRREMLIQTTIWCQLDRGGRPARWAPTGCDTLALKIQTALRQILPDPYRVYIAPQSNIRPFDESYSDGLEYTGASFDSVVTWVDFEELFRYGFGASSAVIEPMEAASGTAETTDGLTTDITPWAAELP